jgi:hypothetical protein
LLHIPDHARRRWASDRLVVPTVASIVLRDCDETGGGAGSTVNKRAFSKKIGQDRSSFKIVFKDVHGRVRPPDGIPHRAAI